MQPDVLARLSRPATAADLRALRQRLRGATIAVGASGGLRLRGHTVDAVGIDPAELARFLPSVTARSQPLWHRVDAGDLAVSFAAAHAARLPLGDVVVVSRPRGVIADVRGALEQVGAPVRLGAFAAFGLPGVDAVASPTTARRLALRPRSLLLVSTRHHQPGVAAEALRRVFGHALVSAEALHTAGPRPQSLRAPWRGSWRQLYQQAAATCPGLPWQVLAAIGTIESDNGRDTGVSSAGARGPMQFLPSTWAMYGIDADHDGRADIDDPVDAAYAAARYLCDNGAAGGGSSLAGAVYAYNHADWYVRDVLALAARIR